MPTGFTYLRPVHPGEMLSISFRPKVHVHNFVQPWTAFRSAAKCALRLAQPNDGCRRSVGASCRRIRQQRFALDAADACVSAPTALSSYGLLTDAVDGSCFNEPRYLCAARRGQPLRQPVADRRGALPRCCWRFGTGEGEPLAGAQHGAAWPPCAAAESTVERDVCTPCTCLHDVCSFTVAETDVSSATMSSTTIHDTA